MAYQFPDGPTAPRETMMILGLPVLYRPGREMVLVTVTELLVLGADQGLQVVDVAVALKDLPVLSTSIVMFLEREVEALVARVP